MHIANQPREKTKMTFNVIGQMVSIVMTLAMMAFVALRFKLMKYSFWQILIRPIFWKDNAPRDWLMDNLIFLYYLIFEVAKFITFVGLVHQLNTNKLAERMPEFYYSSPLGNIVLGLIFMEHFKIIDAVGAYTTKTIKTLFTKQKINNH